jgi:hypothetical protein
MTRPVLALALVAIATLSAAQSDYPEVRNVYTQLNRHVLAKDYAKAKKLFETYGAKGFVYIDKSGAKKSAAALLREMKETLANPELKITKSTTKLGQLKRTGNTLVVPTVGGFEMKMNGPDGVPHTVFGVTKTTDTWIQVSDKWKLQRVQVTSEVMRMDGKLIDN